MSLQAISGFFDPSNEPVKLFGHTAFIGKIHDQQAYTMSLSNEMILAMNQHKKNEEKHLERSRTSLSLQKLVQRAHSHFRFGTSSRVGDFTSHFQARHCKTS
jgi:hypothetical protein